MIIPSGFAQSTFRFNGGGLPFGAALTFGHDLSNYTGDATQAANDLWTAWDSSDMDGMQNQAVSLTSVLVKFGPNATGPSGLRTGVLPGRGTGNMTPPNTAWLVTKVTASGGRSGRGRFFVPGVEENAVANDGAVDSVTLAAMQTRVSAFRTAMVNAHLNPVLLHGAESGIPITTPVEITGLVVAARVATQRRRLRR